MSATVSFVKDATTVEVNGPSRSQPVKGPARYVTGLTAGGERYVYQLASHSLRQWSLQFDLTATQKSELESFYYTTVGGPTSTFTFTDTEGNAHTARFLNTDLSFDRLNSQEFTLQITLETDGVIA